MFTKNINHSGATANYWDLDSVSINYRLGYTIVNLDLYVSAQAKADGEDYLTQKSIRIEETFDVSKAVKTALKDAETPMDDITSEDVEDKEGNIRTVTTRTKFFKNA